MTKISAHPGMRIKAIESYNLRMKFIRQWQKNALNLAKKLPQEIIFLYIKIFHRTILSGPPSQDS